MSEELLLHGATLDAEALQRFLGHVFGANASALANGEAATPVCIWGTHGIGKTMLVEKYTVKNGWKLAYCAPAQFEEMGDLHGLPVIQEREDGTTETEFAPPSWVPREAGPGILLLDDLNRADDRILRGFMQLLQRGELASWGLPEGWQIVATANPEGGDYSVTPMDDAMLTRMLHVSMEFDAKAWARWAVDAGVDPRGINFVLTYPEAVTGRKTTPRSLCQFFAQIANIPDLRTQFDLVHNLGMSALDDVTVQIFASFVNDNMTLLLDPEEILDQFSPGETNEKMKALAWDDETLRVDRLATVCTRLYLHLVHPSYKPQDRHREPLVNFTIFEDLPNDLRLTFHRDLIAEAPETVVRWLRDPRLASLALAGL